MTDPMDFPPAPVTGQHYTSPSGIVYMFDGYGWVTSFYDASTQTLNTLGDIMDQIRVLLQDVDNTSSAGYRYSDDSILLSLNQGLIDMYRMRPDIFLELAFTIPVFNTGMMGEVIGIEQQFISPLIYYTVGLVQARDDEGTQDQRAASFIQTFRNSILTVS